MKLTKPIYVTLIAMTAILIITSSPEKPPSTEETRLNKNIEKITIEEDGIVCYKYSDQTSDKGGLSCLPEDEVLQ